MPGAKSDEEKRTHKVATRESPNVGFEPDAWERFERAVDTVIKSGPIHRPAKERPASKGRVHKGKSRT